MGSSPGNQSDPPTSPGEVIVLCFSVGVVAVGTSWVVCKYLVVLFTSDCPLAKVRASPGTLLSTMLALVVSVQIFGLLTDINFFSHHL